jgi:hypothetical protein
MQKISLDVAVVAVVNEYPHVWGHARRSKGPVLRGYIQKNVDRTFLM